MNNNNNNNNNGTTLFFFIAVIPFVKQFFELKSKLNFLCFNSFESTDLLHCRPPSYYNAD